MRRPIAAMLAGPTAALVAIFGGCSDANAPVSPSQDSGISASDASTTPQPDAAPAEDASSADAGGTEAATGTMSVTLKFKAKVGSADFHCGTTYPGQGATAESVQPRDLRFYVEDLRLVNDRGVEVPVTLDVRAPWQTANVALLDFENGTGECQNGNADTNTVVTGTVPAGTYHGIVFSNAVPEALNHTDPTLAPPPLQSGGMTWGWLYGYKFFVAEMVSTSLPEAGADAGARGIGLVHVGSVGCDNSVDGGDPDFNQPPKVACSQQNRNLVRLDGFAPATSTIIVDVGAVFAGTDMSVNSQCHSDGPACSPPFASLGLSFQTGAQLPSQSAYRVE